MGQIFGGNFLYRQNSSEDSTPATLSIRPSIYVHRLRRRFHPTQRNQQQRTSSAIVPSTFVDLKLLPTEIGLHVLSNLNAVDLSTAACVWRDLGHDDLLWKSICYRTWPCCSAYKNEAFMNKYTFRELYLHMEKGITIFNNDAFEGIEYLIHYQLLDYRFDDLVAFFHTTGGLEPVQKRRFLETRPDVMYRLIELKNFQNHFLPNALRRLFGEIPAPTDDAVAQRFVSQVVNKFSQRFVQCNPTMGLTADEVYVLCYSLIMLSVDFWSPHVKNKMSKREFIRNTRLAITHAVADDFLGHLYDNVYLVGHVVLADVFGTPRRQQDIRNVLL